ncbi:MAG: hypothetical protein JXB35_10440 [Anaerolineae bacterium]|nr:hypothetical protein [Anaerolineae bacterium]
MTQIASGAGFRRVQILLLESDKTLSPPSSGGATATEGYHLSGAKALTLNIPEPEKINHSGDDRVFAADVLPPREAVTAEIRTGKTNLTLDAVLSGVSVATIGEMKLMGRGTDQQGEEPQVCILAYRQALDTDPDSATFGARRWVFALIPSARIVPKGGTMEEGGADENAYAVSPTVVTAYPWGHAFTTADEGCTEAQIMWGISDNIPSIAVWEGDGTTTEFTMPSNAASTDKMSVFDPSTGAEPSGLTKAVGALTFSSAPADGAVIICFYEKAA